MHTQRGMTLIGLVFFLGLLGGGAYVGFRVMPAYIDYWQVRHVLENSLSTGEETPTTREIRMRFAKELGLNNITTVSADDLTLELQGDTLHASLEYTVKKPLWGAMSLCLDFKVEREARQGALHP